MLSALFSSFTIQADASSKQEEAVTSNKAEETPREESAEEQPEAEEEEEAEDVHPQIRAECEDSSKCAGPKTHFLHCQEKVQAGKGFKGEDCVEELFYDKVHMMHCADHCAAPRLFSKLR